MTNALHPEASVQAARQVVQIRYWQHLFNELLKRQPARFRVPIHCAFGHEAIAVAMHPLVKFSINGCGCGVNDGEKFTPCCYFECLLA